MPIWQICTLAQIGLTEMHAGDDGSGGEAAHVWAARLKCTLGMSGAGGKALSIRPVVSHVSQRPPSRSVRACAAFLCADRVSDRFAFSHSEGEEPPYEQYARVEQ